MANRTRGFGAAVIQRREWLRMLAGALPVVAFAQEQQRMPQDRQSRSRQGGGQSRDKASGAGGRSPEDLLIRFPGRLKSVTKKQILLEVENEQELIFRRTKRTRFFDGGKEVKESAAPVGDPVVLEGQRALNGDLDVVNVLWNEKPAQAQP